MSKSAAASSTSKIKIGHGHLRVLQVLVKASKPMSTKDIASQAGFAFPSVVQLRLGAITPEKRKPESLLALELVRIISIDGIREYEITSPGRKALTKLEKENAS